MEKTYYLCFLSRGCPSIFQFGPSLWLNFCWGPITIRLTDERIFITMAMIPLFEATLNEIALIKVNPDFMEQRSKWS